MFFEIWMWIETVALICMYCFLYREILNGKVKEEKEKADVAVKDAEESKTTMQKMDKEMRRCGLIFKEVNGTVGLCYDDDWFMENKKLRKEIDQLRKEVYHLDKMTD